MCINERIFCNLQNAIFSDDRWQNSFVSIFMGSWDDFKNGVVSVPEPTSAEKAQHKKRRAMKPPSVSRSRSSSPPSPSCDRAFVALVKQLFQDFVKTPQMQRWLANLFSKMVSIEKSNTLPLMSGRSGSGRPPKDSRMGVRTDGLVSPLYSRRCETCLKSRFHIPNHPGRPHWQRPGL